MKRVALLITTMTIGLSAAGIAQAGALTLNIDTGDANGTLRAALYDSQSSFDEKKTVARATGPANGGLSTVVFPRLEEGNYGVAVFLDTNDNDELDRNFFGVPTEPYGFSMNPALGFSTPKFDAFRFQHDSEDQQISIQLYGN